MMCGMDYKCMVSVVIPFYSNAIWLNEAIESVLNQTYQNYEIIVVNDGSKENIDDTLSKYGELIKYYTQPNMGAGAARNKGVQMANGKYIAFLDSDDLWDPDKLSVQIEYMETHGEYVWSHCSYRTFGCGDERIVNVDDEVGSIFPKCLASCKIATPCVIVRKDGLLGDNKFSESMRYGQDTYLWVMLSQLYELGHIPKVLCSVRQRGNNAAKRAYVALKAKSELWKNLLSLKDFPLDKVSKSVQCAYKMCFNRFRVIESLSKKIHSQKIVEFLSKVLYLRPYIKFVNARKKAK